MTDKAKAGERSPAKYEDELEESPEFLEDVASWFRHPRGKPWPTPEMVCEFANILLRRGNTAIDFEKLFRNKNYINHIHDEKKLLNAYEFLLEKLEIRFKKDQNDFDPFDKKLSDLLNSLQSIKTHMKSRRILLNHLHGKGLKRLWASNAELYLYHISLIWARAGRTKPLSENHSGPLVHVLVQALQYQGWDVNELAISKWLEERRKKTKKSRANSSSHGPENMHHKNASRR
ncbi:hypothetical protein [Acidiphilium sp.]|uniref:hypothetical protein n=1 Tax=Acidiphilium sp. TaxID=527 RepID=UPI0025851CEF|nr:hypothetical protein [Acidiphilium sp.]